MNSKGTRERLMLFDSYAMNLSFYHPHFKDTFLCPLCLRDFPRGAVENGNVTEEHIIPEAIGGRLTTLTCKQCNNKDGTKLDAHLVQRLRTGDTLAGRSKSPLKARVTIGKGEFGANIYLSADEEPTITVIGIPRISNPKLHRLAIDEFEQGKHELSFHARLGFKDMPSRVAALRSAYLLAFHYFGYGYILYKCADLLRTQIAQPNRETPVLKGLIWLKEAPPEINTIGVVTQPTDLRCFFAVLDLSTAVSHHLGVVLPGLDQEPTEIYERWAKLGDAGVRVIKPNIKTLPYDPEYVSNPANKFLPARLWRSLL